MNWRLVLIAQRSRQSKCTGLEVWHFCVRPFNRLLGYFGFLYFVFFSLIFVLFLKFSLFLLDSLFIAVRVQRLQLIGYSVFGSVYLPLLVLS